MSRWSEFALAGLVMLAIAGVWSFFWFSRNARLKRRLWPAYGIVGAVVILLFLWFMGIPNELLYLAVPVFMIGALINLRAVKFCGSCGATVSAFRIPQARFCPECGSSLEQRR
jgi:hypothetical protein